MRQTFVTAAGVIFPVVIVYRALFFRCYIMFHADHPIGMVMMGNKGYCQHNDADDK